MKTKPRIQSVCLSLLFLAWTAALHAAQFGDFSYESSGTGGIIITGYTGAGGDVTVPDTIAGLPVTSIGYAAFHGCNLTSVAIPSTVSYIAGPAFLGSKGLMAIDVASANPSYSSLDGVLFHKRPTTLIQYPAGKVGAYTIPESVTSIGNSAFAGCIGLTSITIPDTVTTIEYGAFAGCVGLTAVMIPHSVTLIKERAFSGCASLTAIEVAVMNPVYSSFDGVLLDTPPTTLLFCPSGKTGAFTIPGSVNAIASEAFSSCAGLTSIIITDRVFWIGSTAFAGCKGLTSVTIPKSVTSIGDAAFSGCTKLTSLEVAALNPVYSSVDGVLFNKPQTTLMLCPPGKTGTFTVPDSVNAIGQSAFAGCTGLTSLMIADNVVSIGAQAFGGCTNLRTIEVAALNPVYSSFEGVVFNKSQTTLMLCPPGKTGTFTVPGHVTTIADQAFFACTRLTSVTIGNNVTRIGPNVFSGCSGLTSVTIPDSVTSIGGSAFYGCSGLTSVTIGNRVTSIGDYAFSGCTGLTGIVIPNSFSIGEHAFRECTSLASVLLGNSVTSIEQATFLWCTNLASVTIPDSVTRIGRGTFSYCTSLTDIVIPDSVQVIEDAFESGGRRDTSGTFSRCTSLKNVTLGNGLSRIASGMFDGCTRLTSVTIPDNVTRIGRGAFQDCTSLTVLTIPASVIGIEGLAFRGCTGLTSLVIPTGVTSIEEGAFELCITLKALYFQGNAPDVSESVFDRADNVTICYLPGTTGWGPVYAGRPTALWANPVILEGTLGTKANALGFSIAWAPDATVVVEATTDLTAPIWVPVSTHVLAGGVAEFRDPEPTSSAARFYRLRSP